MSVVQFTNGQDVESGRERVYSNTLHSDGEDGTGNGVSQKNGKLEFAEERPAKVDFVDPAGDRYDPKTKLQ